MEIIKVDYTNQRHADMMMQMLRMYAIDPFGGGEPLSEYVEANLIQQLQETPFAFSLLAMDGDDPIGLANCFFGFSTFAAKPLINIHDLVVKSEVRGKGIGKQLLSEVERIAMEHGCCKITLEVLEGNERAQRVYKAVGFDGYELGEGGKALFWQKKLV